MHDKVLKLTDVPLKLATGAAACVTVQRCTPLILHNEFSLLVAKMWKLLPDIFCGSWKQRTLIMSEGYFGLFGLGDQCCLCYKLLAWTTIIMHWLNVTLCCCWAHTTVQPPAWCWDGSVSAAETRINRAEPRRQIMRRVTEVQRQLSPPQVVVYICGWVRGSSSGM